MSTNPVKFYDIESITMAPESGCLAIQILQKSSERHVHICDQNAIGLSLPQSYRFQPITQGLLTMKELYQIFLLHY